MSGENIRNVRQDPATRDELDDIKRQTFQKFVSPWQSIAGSATGTFRHNLGEIPHVVSVLEATDSQGSNQAEASSVTVTRTGTIVSVANTGSARFFRVRAF